MKKELLKGLTEEQINKARKCKTNKELLALAEKEGVNEQLKANDQMLWVRKMNNIRNQAMEIIDEELIYT